MKSTPPTIVPHPRAHVHPHPHAHAPIHPAGHVTPPVGERRRQVRIARLVFLAFIVTFVVSRVVVFLIMSSILPDIFMHYGETHVHHLNYGIFLLSAVGAYLLMRRPEGRALRIAAVTYGIGLALTFDEFGMWLNLGGGYWQRASFDTMTLLAGILGLIAYAPALRRFRPRHWATAVLVGIMTIVFFVMLVDSFRHFARTMGPRFQRLDDNPIHTPR